MSIKKLNQHQIKRIASKQQLDTIKPQAEGQEEGVVSQASKRFCIILTQTGEKIKCRLSMDADLVAGDKVLVDLRGNHPKIMGRAKRDNQIISQQNHFSRVIAANLDQILIFSAILPKPSMLFIDRMLANCIHLDALTIKTVVMINKSDLLNQKNTAYFLSLKSYYEKWGYPVQIFSAAKDTLETLLSFVSGKKSLLLGESGVGKTSYINRLFPDLDLKTQVLTKAKIGKHTTSEATLYPLDSSASVIDCPGTRLIYLAHIDPKRLIQAFPDLAHYAQNCQFNDCAHDKEAHCGVKEALQSGEIMSSRLYSYRQILLEITPSY